MTILYQYSAFRTQFATVARTTGVSLTYDHVSMPNTVTRVSGSFVTDGFVAGQSLDVSGTTDSDARYTIATVAALTITLITGEQFNSSETIVSSLTGATYELDGAETWPQALVRANGFSSTFALTPRPITIFPAQLTCNALVTDATAGSSYKWFIRQPQVEPALQWITATHASALSTGTIAIDLTGPAETDIGAVTLTKLTFEQQLRLLKGVTVFVKRLSDGAIQFVDLFELSHAQTS